MGDVDDIEGDVDSDKELESESFKIEPRDLNNPENEITENGIRNIYTCTICEETFTTDGDYDNHMDSHKDEVPI